MADNDKAQYWDEGTFTQTEIDALIEKNKNPGIFLVRQWPFKEISNNGSYLGGAPTLPKDMHWPLNLVTGRPLHFLAQINCALMPRIEGGPNLPKSGMLFFFADINEDMLWFEHPHGKIGTERPHYSRVLYSKENHLDLRQRPTPVSTPDISHADRQQSGNHAQHGHNAYPSWPISAHLIENYTQSENPFERESNRDYVSQTTIIFKDQKQQYFPSRSNEIERKNRHEKISLKELDVEAVRRNGPKVGPVYKYLDLNGESVAPESAIRDQETGFELAYYHKIAAELMDANFPYCGLLGQKIITFYLNRTKLSLADCRRKEAYNIEKVSDLRRKHPEGPPKDQIEQCRFNIEIAQRKIVLSLKFLNDCQYFENIFNRLDPYDQIEQNISMAFLRWIDTGINYGPGVNYLMCNAFEGPLPRIVADSVGDEKLNDILPIRFRDIFESELIPKIGSSEHLIFGTQSNAPNTTGGEGVRLLQLSSDHGINFMFCDNGVIDFWISKKDLDRGFFDHAYACTAGG